MSDPGSSRRATGPKREGGARRVLRAADLKEITEARLSLANPGRPPDTARTLGFALDHARARAAVLSELDETALAAQLAGAGLDATWVTSAAGERDTYIRRPDLGRRLPDEAAGRLRDAGPADVALVLGDGLSATAVTLNGVAFLAALHGLLEDEGLHMRIVCARQARVALGDGIARALGAESVVMALGERPGLSAADSLGVYVTHRPLAETPDSHRNCISNIRAAGTSVATAARQTRDLLRAMRETGLSGVALNQHRAGPGLAAPDT